MTFTKDQFTFTDQYTGENYYVSHEVNKHGVNGVTIGTLSDNSGQLREEVTLSEKDLSDLHSLLLYIGHSMDLCDVLEFLEENNAI